MPDQVQASSFLDRLKSVFDAIARPAHGEGYLIAYSGGVDSHVLLFACHKLGLPIRAIHIHHGLQQVADHWVGHCQQMCDDLGIELAIAHVDSGRKAGTRRSPEEAARVARYDALYAELKDGECLLTAQHLDDQAETLLLQLMRGAGPAGLAGMPVQSRRGGYHHLRPLLDFSRAEIENFAYDNALDWVDDPSNLDTRIDRNFIRQQLMPLITSRWTDANNQLVSSAALQADALDVLEDMAATDLADATLSWRSPTSAARYDVLSVLAIDRISRLSSSRLNNLLRYWITCVLKQDGLKHRQSSPTRKLLREIVESLLMAQEDAMPKIVFAGIEFRRYQDKLFILQERIIDAPAEQHYDWPPDDSLRVQGQRITRVSAATSTMAITQPLQGSELGVRFRSGGEMLRPAGRTHTQALKKLLQQEGVPPWDRDSLPLFYHGEELVAVADLFIADSVKAKPEEQGWCILIERPDQ